MVEQQRERSFESRKQEEAAKKIEAEQWKWIWLIPLFEILQTIRLALFALKYQVAKKSVIAMTVVGRTHLNLELKDNSQNQ